jgi:phosphate transport system substrate-binding protein
MRKERNMGTRMKKSLVLLPVIALLMMAIVLAGCAGGTSINITGSNTVTPLSSVWAEDYMDANPDVSIAVSGPGSGVGIAALIDSTTDICQASRKIKDSEVYQAQDNGVNPYEIQVATDALSVVVHPDNPVSELTIEQLSDIYTNKVTNWQEVGGNNAPIVAIARDTNSGTHVFFKEEVVQMDGLPTEDTSLEYGDQVLFLPSTKEGVNEVAKNVNAIFYPGLGYVTDDVKPLGVKRTDADTAVYPSVETALDGTYPIARPLLYYTDGAPTGVVKDYIDYCLSDEGQAKVLEVGYVPLP